MQVEGLPPKDYTLSITITAEEASTLYAATRAGRRTTAQADLLRELGNQLDAATQGALSVQFREQGDQGGEDANT